MLLFHILIALVSLLFTTYLYFFPSETKLYTAEAMVLLTTVSGIYLVFSKSVNILQVCLTGLAYLVAVSIGLMATRKKLAVVHSA